MNEKSENWKKSKKKYIYVYNKENKQEEHKRNKYKKKWTLKEQER